MLAFYIYFLKLELNCDEENMFILNIRSFQEKMLSNLAYALTYSLTKYVIEDGFKDSRILKVL